MFALLSFRTMRIRAYPSIISMVYKSTFFRIFSFFLVLLPSKAIEDVTWPSGDTKFPFIFQQSKTKGNLSLAELVEEFQKAFK